MEDKNIKEKILKALEPKKTFTIGWGETRWYSKEIEAVDKEELEEIWGNGDFDYDDEDCYEINTIEDSFDIED